MITGKLRYPFPGDKALNMQCDQGCTQLCSSYNTGATEDADFVAQKKKP